MRVLSADEAKTHRVISADPSCPPDFIFLDGYDLNGITYVCGSCERPLATNIGAGPVLLNLAFVCPRCGAVNEWETRSLS